MYEKYLKQATQRREHDVAEYYRTVIANLKREQALRPE